MHELIARMIEGGPVLTDGAWGTQMQARGLDVGACPDEWNLSNPRAVEEVAQAYVGRRQPSDHHEYVWGYAFLSGTTRPGRQGCGDQPGRRGDFSASCR